MGMVYGKTAPDDGPDEVARFKAAEEALGRPLTKEEKVMIRRTEQQMQTYLAHDAMDLVRAFQTKVKDDLSKKLTEEGATEEELKAALTEALMIIAILSRKIEFDRQVEDALQVAKMPEIITS